MHASANGLKIVTGFIKPAYRMSGLNPAGNFGCAVLGLDYCGCILLNSKEIFRFNNTYLPHVIDLTADLLASGNMLQIVFECPPRWLGQCGWTSKMTQWKPRFNYSWDWTSRLVQIGIWDGIYLDAVTDAELQNISIAADVDFSSRTGKLGVREKQAVQVIVA